ncbi:protein with gyf domain [Cryptosporidium sp. chipmunk genotype I]|uniref:protein with gyf domain n=1 Tax=Cryptosporidium sp. chipmunk genotype I TaxID=1280935 RepID=UPI00351A111A|nr:protein with gyf domain [Cryptosporidium sp. chipmunk genotype I]
MDQELRLTNDKNEYNIELSIFLGSINVTINDDNQINCRFFSLVVDIEPSFNLENSLKEINAQEQNIFDYNDSDIDGCEKTQFRTSWYVTTDTPLHAAYGVFSSEISGVIKECNINQDVSLNLKLPTWVSNMAKQFYNVYDQIGFENFLLTVLQLRITIWAASNSTIESAEIFEVGEVVIKVSENHLLSKNSFYFIHRIPDHDAFTIKKCTRKDEECTIGILKCFFNSRPVIIKNINQDLKDICESNAILYDFPKENSVLIQKLRISKENVLEQLHDFVPLKWEYLDDNNVIRGPYNSIVMISWIVKGYFRENSQLRLFDFGQGSLCESSTPMNFKKFQPLSNYLSLIKSDVSRIFRFSSENGVNRDLAVREPNDEKTNLHSEEMTNRSFSREKNTKFIKKSYEGKRIEIENAVKILKIQFSHIEKEFQNKFRRKVQDKKTDNRFSSEARDINRDEFIEFAIKNVFRQKNNVLFKKWCAEYGPELVLEACAIRIQTAFRKYIRKKHLSTQVLQRHLYEAYLEQARGIDNPTGFWLLFIPTFGSLSFASNSLLPKANLAALFALESVACRSTGCVINDLADRQFDSKVERTKNRPLASGEITFIKALIALIGSSATSAAVLSKLNKITHYPQLFLGFTFNWGILLAWTSVHGCFNPYRNSWLCPISYYISSVCWSVHYDTIYAHQDKLFDKQIGLFSTALKWNETQEVICL